MNHRLSGIISIEHSIFRNWTMQSGWVISRLVGCTIELAIRLSRDPAVWSSFVNEGTIHIVNRAVTRGNMGRGSKKTGLGRVDFSSVFG